MNDPPLPPRLTAALGNWHDAPTTAVLVAQVELFRHRVQVRRLTLGDPRRAEFGTLRVVYTSPAQEGESR